MSARAKAWIVLCLGVLVVLGGVMEGLARVRQGEAATRLAAEGRWMPATNISVWISDSSGSRTNRKCRVMQARAVVDGRYVTFTNLERASSIGCTSAAAGWTSPTPDLGFREGMEVWLPTEAPGTAITRSDLERDLAGGNWSVGVLVSLLGAGIAALGFWGVRGPE